MTIAMNLKVDGHSPIPIRRQLTEQLKHAIETGGVARDQALPSIRELAGFLGINPNTVARGGHELLPSPGGGAAPARQGGSGDRAPRRGASRDPPPPGPAPVGHAG